MELIPEILNRIKCDVAKELKNLDVWVDERHFKESTNLDIGAEKFYNEVCRRYAEEVNKAGLKAEACFINTIVEHEATISRLNKRIDEKDSKIDILESDILALHELNKQGFYEAHHHYGKYKDEISQLKKQLEEKDEELNRTYMANGEAQKVIYKLNSKLEVKEKPDLTFEQDLMVESTARYLGASRGAPIAKEGFIKGAQWAKSKTDAAIAELENKLKENNLIQFKALSERDARIAELEKERDQSWPAKDEEVEKLENEIEKLKQSRLASIKASLEKATDKAEELVSRQDTHDQISLLDLEKCITNEYNIVIVP